jgi:hypothetical protein
VSTNWSELNQLSTDVQLFYEKESQPKIKRRIADKIKMYIEGKVVAPSAELQRSINKIKEKNDIYSRKRTPRQRRTDDKKAKKRMVTVFNILLRLNTRSFTHILMFHPCTHTYIQLSTQHDVYGSVQSYDWLTCIT